MQLRLSAAVLFHVALEHEEQSKFVLSQCTISGFLETTIGVDTVTDWQTNVLSHVI
jgi:hypothetical protein